MTLQRLRNDYLTIVLVFRHHPNQNALYTLILSVGLTGFFFLYHTSLKMKLDRSAGLSHWIAEHAGMAKGIGSICLLLAMLALVWTDGLGAGVFTALLLLMAGAAIIVALPPLRLFKPVHLIALILLSLLFELFIFN